MQDYLTNADVKLKAAEAAYFLTGMPVMSDEEYDILAETAAREGGCPRPVGARPMARDACLLPVPMPSLRKVKPGMMRDWEGRQAVVSEKLDGISALWSTATGRLYLRGDQQYGVEKTAFVPLIGGLVRPTTPMIVRGEIVMVKNNSADRNLVNGYLHRLSPDDQVPAGIMKFIAYSICSVGQTAAVPARRDQFRIMAEAGFEVAWNIIIKVREEWLGEQLKRRREQGMYSIDGLVVADVGVPAACAATDAYPSDAVAFKMPLADQMATTKIMEIDWNVGRAGVWTPRLRIQPVMIGGARIEWVTGHNAAWIRDRGIAVGAEVIIRRSGDVIPIIDSVVRAVANTVWPEGEWDGVHIVQGKRESVKTIVHALELMGVKQCGEERIKKLGVETLREFFEVEESVWASAIGPAIGPKLRSEVLAKAREADHIIRVMAYPYLPAAVGVKRLMAWAGAAAGTRPEGWGEATWAAFTKEYPAILKWIEDTFRSVVSGSAVKAKSTQKKPEGALAPLMVTMNGQQKPAYMTLTGFRDPELTQRAEARGWVVGDLSKKTTHLVIKAGYENKKTEKAREDGIMIWTREEALANL